MAKAGPVRPRIISVSRRSDIPRYYAAWLAQRHRAGSASFRNCFGGGGSVSLRPDDVLGYLFWTRLFEPALPFLQTLRQEGTPFACQYTITGYGREVEPRTPSVPVAVADLYRLSALTAGRACVQWRYDPVLISDTMPVAFHEENFGRIAEQVRGAVQVVNVSLTEPYLKAIRRLGDASVQFRTVDPARHRSVAKNPPLQVGDDLGEMLRSLDQIAKANGLQLRACCNPEIGLPRAQCCSAEMFAPWGGPKAQAIAALGGGPSRAACRCLEVVDIGMDNTCIAGCKYCYVVVSDKTALRNFGKHDPGAESLR